MDLHFTINQETERFLADLAKHSKKTVADFAQEIFQEALDEHHADAYDLAIAAKRDVPGAKRISHEDAWK